jgi:hypothetical protein
LHRHCGQWVNGEPRETSNGVPKDGSGSANKKAILQNHLVVL